MEIIEDIERQLNIKFPDTFKEFLLKVDTFVVENTYFCRILRDNYRTDMIVHEFCPANDFIAYQERREYLIEMQNDFEVPVDYVEAEYLYYIASTENGGICIALDGQHYGKIYSMDSGDFGIIYQANNINEFLDSLYEPSKFRCTYKELIEAVTQNNLNLLMELVETKDGDKRIEYSSWHDIKLFEIAYNSGFENILIYLISRGYNGCNRFDRLNLNL
jgi:hypothetical protein